jgi:4-amino-4-deoxy-L-arabinose transferase-like glycosyltransferase
MSILERKPFLNISIAHLLLAGIVLLSVFLHFSNLDAIGDANTYYTAAVESMTQSFSNFFFVAAEPGGAVSVDKPPLGLWVEAVFALVLGVSGFSTSLPNMLAGVFSVPLLYALVSRYSGKLAGLLAALVLVITPVALATDRNNTMDGLLVFVLLVAAWTFVHATESGKLAWLLLGAFIVGLGFNIKMLQAFLPLPAFYALYFLGANTGWGRKIIHLGLATLVVVLVSLSWAIAVDLTPAELRPYVGSSEDNTVMELIVGHNGLSRLFNPRAANTPSDSAPAVPQAPADNPALNPQTGSAPPAAFAACRDQSFGDSCTFTPRNGNAVSGRCIQPPQGDQLACAPVNGSGLNPPPGALGDGPNASPDAPNASGVPFSQETGSPGALRFFSAPLSKQMSWLLPLALISMLAVLFAAQVRLPLEAAHKALLLWGGWLVTCLVFFSMVEGIFHAYYTIMLAPAQGALVGIGAAQFWNWQKEHPAARLLWIFAAGLTLAFQVYTAAQYGLDNLLLLAAPALALMMAGIGLGLFRSLHKAAFITQVMALLILPAVWTGLTVFDEMPNAALPTASQFSPGDRPGAAERPLNELNPVNEEMFTYLQANTQNVEYLLATPNAHSGAPFILASGRPVLYIGGFGGGDPVIDAAGLAEMVADGELRYVLWSGQNDKREISQWVEGSCRPVMQFNRPNQNQPTGPKQENNSLYDCGQG